MRGRFDYSRWNRCASCGDRNPKPKNMSNCDVHPNIRLRTRARFKGGRKHANTTRIVQIKGLADNEFEVTIIRRFDTATRRIKGVSVLEVVKQCNPKADEHS